MKEFDALQIFIGNHALSQHNRVNYLGMLIRDDCKDDDSMLSSIKGIYTRGNLLTRKFSKCSKEVKVKLFQSYCCNMYCCALWNNVSIPTSKKLKVSHNDALRMLFNIRRGESISRLFCVFNIPNFNILQRKAILSLHHRLLSSTNMLIATIVDVHSFTGLSMYRWWTSVIV